MPWSEYREKFERGNVCDLDPLSSARIADRTVLVLGREAWRLMLLLETTRFFGSQTDRVCNTKFILLPHPSGRNLFYNDPANRERVTKLLQEIK